MCYNHNNNNKNGNNKNHQRLQFDKNECKDTRHAQPRIFILIT